MSRRPRAMRCTHDITDAEVAIACDGLCPLCLRTENERLRVALGKILDSGLDDCECNVCATARRALAPTTKEHA